MIELGKCYTCQMVKIESDGLLVKMKEGEDELMVKPKLEIPFQAGKEVEVFSWMRGDDGRNWGSLTIPELELGEVAFLRVSSETKFGYFLDWGLEKDLFCPFSNILGEPKADMVVPVRLLLDEATNRLLATMKWKKQTEPATEDLFYRSMEVEIQVMEPAEQGFAVLVNQYFLGMIYENQMFRSVRTGQKLSAFVNKVREDGRLDILLQRPGYGEVLDASDLLLQSIEEAGGKLAIGDKSDAAEIYKLLKMSKKTFKKAVGALYKSGKIGIADTRIWKISYDGD